jgi:hypothetical protein
MLYFVLSIVGVMSIIKFYQYQIHYEKYDEYKMWFNGI